MSSARHSVYSGRRLFGIINTLDVIRMTFEEIIMTYKVIRKMLIVLSMSLVLISKTLDEI